MTWWAALGRKSPMRVKIVDRDALLEISPAALGVFARRAGWNQHGTYRESSDIYVGESLPEIIVPRIAELGDYANVVAGLIEAFAEVTGQDELTVYQQLSTGGQEAGNG